MRIIYILLLLPLVAVGQTAPEHEDGEGEASKKRRIVVIDNFEAYRPEGLPNQWLTNRGSSPLVPVSPEMMNDQERFIIKEERGNKFVRAMMNDQAHRLVILNEGPNLDWNLSELPYLRWKWRAVELPEGAREDERGKNDTGAAVYVTFGRDWLGRPKSIKYTYSSTLPVGTTVSYGPLKVLVVASAVDQGTGEWMTVERNVVADYRLLFGKDPEERPIGIILWSDSDTLDTTAVADFDDIAVLSPPAR